MAQFVANDVTKETAAAFKAMSSPIATAATAAVKTAGDNLKTSGRESIRKAGFSARTANTWRVKFYPQTGRSVDSAAFAYWKLPYGAIFEEGGTILGKPLLWLPMANLPKRIGRGKPTPKNVRERGVRLFQLNIHGEPYLAASVRVPKGQRDKPVTSVTINELRQGQRAIGRKSKSKTVLKAVPLFHGLKNVTLRKRTHLREIADFERARLPEYYDRSLKV